MVIVKGLFLYFSDQRKAITPRSHLLSNADGKLNERSAAHKIGATTFYCRENCAKNVGNHAVAMPIIRQLTFEINGVSAYHWY